MFNNLKLAVKIGGGFVLVLLLTVLIAALSVLSLNNLERTSYKNDTTSDMVENMLSGTVAGKNYVISKTDSYRADIEKYMGNIILLATDLRDRESNAKDRKIMDQIIEGATTYRTNFNDYAKYEEQKTAKQKELAAQAEVLESAILRLEGNGPLMVMLYKSRLNVYQYLLSKDSQAVDQMRVLMKDIVSSAGSRGAGGQQVAENAKRYMVITDEYVNLNALQEESRVKAADGGALTSKNASELNASAAAEMASLIRGTVIFVLISAFIAILVGLVMTIVITRLITGAMRKGVDFAVEIAGGNLDAQLDIHQEDEIGMLASALQNMLAKLTGIVEEVNAAARQVAAGSQQLSSTAQQMSQGATEQAASVEEISSSMEEMTSNIKQNADNAMQTEKMAQKSAMAAEEGGRAVTATVSAMKEIASKIGIIEEIARSTNMLALNASIEAARAGEYGKGFAVVASEVGKLAERSQKEAGEISKLSAESVTIAEQAGVTIAAMIPDIKRTAELVQEISAASNEQNSGAEQINAAILQLDKVVQQNASASEESASMSEELASQADQMQGTMGFFKLSSGAGQRRDASGRAQPSVAETPERKPAATLQPKTGSDRPAPAARTKAAVATGSAPKSDAAPSKKPAAAPDGDTGDAPAAKDNPRLPLSGIHLVLDDGEKTDAHDALDGDFKEF